MSKPNGGTHEPQFQPKRGTPVESIAGKQKRFRSNPVSYDGISNQTIRDAVVAVTRSGAAILFGTTSDGGAFYLRVYDGDDFIKEYPTSDENCEATLKWLIDMYSSD